MQYQSASSGSPSRYTGATDILYDSLGVYPLDALSDDPSSPSVEGEWGVAVVVAFTRSWDGHEEVAPNLHALHGIASEVAVPQELSGLRVVSFESRRSVEMAELIRNYGGEPIQAPSMREVPLADQHEALVFGEGLLTGHHDLLILLTGVGTRLLIAALSTRWPRDQVVAALGRLPLVCRGPKPVAALKEVGLAPALRVPEPNTWRDLLLELDRALPIAGKRVAVQEYGARNEELLAGLRQRGARVTRVPVYGWALPEDVAPLRAAIERIVSGEVDVALFSSATQVENVFRVALDMGRGEALEEAFRERTVVASIGPVTTEALQGYGIEPDLHPDRPKMGHLVAAVARRAPELLERKRRTRRP